jgi:uncharacterized membrane protein
MSETKEPKEIKVSKEDIEKNKIWAVVAYLGLIGFLLALLLDGKDSPFVKFHINQALPLIIASIFVWIPFIGWAIGIGVFILWIMGIINAAQGKMVRLPITGNFDLIK